MTGTLILADFMSNKQSIMEFVVEIIQKSVKNGQICLFQRAVRIRRRANFHKVHFASAYSAFL